MKRAFSFLSLCLLLSSLLTTARADSLDRFVRETMVKRKIPGLSIAVMRDGKVIRAGGYGLANLETRTAASKDTVYEIGSISKQFAAEAVMLLAQDGKIDVDDPITDHLPANAPETWRAITVRNLLNHTSGLKDWTEIKEFSYRREYTPEEFIDLVKPFPLQFRPNENWLYSNTNLPLIGIIVERASGESFEDFVVRRIIKPLNLVSVRFKHQGDLVSNRASGYVLLDNEWKNGEPFRPKVIAASGGILATAVDLARWWEAVLEGRLVRKKGLDQMLAPTRLSSGKTVAHGFAFFSDSFNGHRMVQHFGSTVGGFGSIVRYYPSEKLTVAVIGNLGDGGFGSEYIAKRVADLYIPGAFAAGMKESPDITPDQTKFHRQILKDISENKTPESLSANFASKIGDQLRSQLREDFKQAKSFSFLGMEPITPNHFVLDPTAAEVFHYKMVLPGRTVYYHFRIDTERKIGWISSEE